jgi:spore coat protein U domain-containing protein, fimbrial subunit CupE1/2/3/6
VTTRILGALLLLAGVAARADAACTISSTSVLFGAYDVFGVSPTTSTGTITYQCNNADKDVLISVSVGSSGSYVARTLVKGAERLNYNLYLDAAFSTVWGDGTGGTDTYFKHNPQNNRDVDVTVYGRILAQQDVSAGAYADTIVITVNF